MNHQPTERRSAGSRAVRIAGLGRYLPRQVVTNEELEGRFDLPEGWIQERTGVRERRRADVDGGECASEMGAHAAREALEEACFEPRDLDLIVNASGTPEQVIPDGGALLQRELGLERSGVASFSVHATCLGFIAALDVVASLLETDRYRRALIVCSEVASLGVAGVDPKSESLFGDAAAAAVITASIETDSDGLDSVAETGATSSLDSLLFRTWSQGADLTAIPGGGTRRHPLREDAVPDELRFAMNGPAVLQLCLRRAGKFFDELHPSLRVHGMSGSGPRDAVDVAITHQPSKAGLDAMERFGVERALTVRTLESLGNCVAASLPLTLVEAVRSGRLVRGQRALLFGTGAGLSMAGALLRY